MIPMHLAGKVALITGGARGIGHATAELFAREGACVHVGDLDFPSLFAAASVVTHKLDVTDSFNWKSVVDAVLAANGKIDMLFNNATTVMSYEGIAEISIEDWHRVIAINQTVPFLGMRTVIPHMRAVGGGSIINTSSIWAR